MTGAGGREKHVGLARCASRDGSESVLAPADTRRRPREPAGVCRESTDQKAGDDRQECTPNHCRRQHTEMMVVTEASRGHVYCCRHTLTKLGQEQNRE